MFGDESNKLKLRSRRN